MSARFSLLLTISCVLAALGCAQPVEIVAPRRYSSVPVHVMNPPWNALGSTTWRNDCEAIPRLGADEPRATWLSRVEAYVEASAWRLASVTYPPGAGVEIALVCFSTETIVPPSDTPPDTGAEDPGAPGR